MNYWLFKSEPDAYSFADLKREKDRTTCWDGIRNYQARNTLRDRVRVGDRVLFYHSRVKPMAVVGTARVVREAYPDPTQFDASSRYHDPGSDPENPR
ncbi:MAG: EVE domain-containing protein, partial [Planctomycetota bacterium]